MSPGKTFILGRKVKYQGHEVEKQYLGRFLHSCECWLLLVPIALQS